MCPADDVQIKVPDNTWAKYDDGNYYKCTVLSRSGKYAILLLCLCAAFILYCMHAYM